MVMKFKIKVQILCGFVPSLENKYLTSRKEFELNTSEGQALIQSNRRVQVSNQRVHDTPTAGLPAAQQHLI